MKAACLIASLVLLAGGGLLAFAPAETSSITTINPDPSPALPPLAGSYTYRQWDWRLNMTGGYVIIKIRFSWIDDADPDFLYWEIWCYEYDDTDTLLCSSKRDGNANNGEAKEGKTTQKLVIDNWCDEQIYYKIESDGYGYGTQPQISTLVNSDHAVDKLKIEDSSTGQDISMTLTNDSGIQQS
jgi:hypothetical protein